MDTLVLKLKAQNPIFIKFQLLIMKKKNMILSALALCLAVGGALAFKSIKLDVNDVWYKNGDDYIKICNLQGQVSCPNYTVTSGGLYYTQPTTGSYSVITDGTPLFQISE